MPSTLRRRPRLRLLDAWLGLVALAATVLWSAVGIRRHQQLRTGMDLAIFGEALHRFAHGQVPVSTMKSPNFPLWFDHFHPILAVVAPFFWVWDDPQVLVVVQALCIGAATWIIGRSAAPRLGQGWAVLFAAAFAVSPGIQAGATFDFHEVALGMPILAVGLALVLDERYRAAALVLALLMLVKEDSSFVLAGAALMLWFKGARKEAVALGGFGVAWTAIVTMWWIPTFSPAHRYLYAGALKVSEIPAGLEASLLRPGTLTAACVFMLAAVGFAAVRSPIVWVALVPTVPRMLSPYPLYHWLSFHYWLLPAVALTYATLDVWASLSERSRRWRLGLIAVVAALSLLTGPGGRDLLHAPNPRAASAAAILAEVPDDARVGADVFLTPHLATRTRVSQIRPPLFTDDLGFRLDKDYLVLDRLTTSYQGGWVEGYLRTLGPGWTIVDERDGFLLLKKS